MADVKRACLVFVTATASKRGPVKARLEEDGYSVCEVKAELEYALAARAGESELPIALVECISGSDLCVFLLPEDQADDALVGGAATLANKLQKRVVGVVAGARAVYPESFDDHAASMVREDSVRLHDAICGSEIWERPNGSLIGDRPIKHVRCQ